MPKFLKSSWSDLSWGEYQQMLTLTSDLDILSFLSGYSKDDLLDFPFAVVSTLYDHIDFIKTPPDVLIYEYPITTEDWLNYSTGDTIEEIVGIDDNTPMLEAFSKVKSFNYTLTEIMEMSSILFKGGGNPSTFAKNYGTLSIILNVCKVTLTPFDTVLTWPLPKTLNIACYNVQRSEYELNQLKSKR